MRILGISCYYHDAAACLVVDGRVVAAAAEERFTRIKHDNAFPTHAIAFCLEWLGITVHDIDAIAFYEKPIVKFTRVVSQHASSFPRSYKTFLDTFSSWFDIKLQVPKTLKKEFGFTGPIYYLEHHLSHAASAFYPSDFSESVIVTLDGVGEWTTTAVGIGKNLDIHIDREIQFPHSLGLLYSTMTSYLGFSVNDSEYKVMGLAAYGDPNPFYPLMSKLITQFPDGSFALNMKYFDYIWSDRMYGGALEALFGYPRRKPESPMTPVYENIAAALQKKT